MIFTDKSITSYEKFAFLITFNVRASYANGF